MGLWSPRRVEAMELRALAGGGGGGKVHRSFASLRMTVLYCWAQLLFDRNCGYLAVKGAKEAVLPK
jgi:hypothetical protein